MNDAIKTQISAFVDGELPENEAELLLRRMSQDRELRQQAAEYLALGRAIRGEKTFPGMASLRGRIATALDAEAVPEPALVEQTRKFNYLKPLAGAAIAATVALGAIVGLQRVAGVDEAVPSATVAEVESPGYTVPVPAEDKLREYYLRHAASSAYVGADSINARLVTLELADGVVVELQPEPEPEAAGEADTAESDQQAP